LAAKGLSTNTVGSLGSTSSSALDVSPVSNLLSSTPIPSSAQDALAVGNSLGSTPIPFSAQDVLAVGNTLDGLGSTLIPSSALDASAVDANTLGSIVNLSARKRAGKMRPGTSLTPRFVDILLSIPTLMSVRNLCAREWVKANPTGTTVEFKEYFDSLSTADRKVGSLVNISDCHTNSFLYLQKYQDLAGGLKIN
jgi:hypothetical protein